MKARVNDRCEYENLHKPDLKVKSLGPNRYLLVQNGRSVTLEVLEFDARAKFCEVAMNGFVFQVNLEDELDSIVHRIRQQSETTSGDVVLTAPIPGMIKSLSDREGQPIQAGEPILVLEAMKMENAIQAPVDADEVRFHVKPGDRVSKGQKLFTLSQSTEI